MIALLLIGFLLLAGLSLIVLDASIEGAEEGYEDNFGFHQVSREPETGPTPSEEGITLWDRVEGACCSLDMAPSFRPVGNNQFPPHQP